MSKAPPKVRASAQETALKNASTASWNDYIAKYRPAEAALAKEAELTAGERAGIKGAVSGDVAEAFKGLTRDTVAAGGQSGADVNSGKTKLSLAGDADARGRATGAGQNVADVTAGIESEQKKLSIVGHGRGVQTDTAKFAARGARRANTVAMAASNAKFARNTARTDALFGIAGAATKKLGLDEKIKGVFQSDLEEIEVTGRRRGVEFSPSAVSGNFDSSFESFV